MEKKPRRFAAVALLMLGLLFVGYPLSAGPVLCCGERIYGTLEFSDGFVRVYETVYWPFMHAPAPIQDAFGSWVDLWISEG
jgi:hypothetical protein